MIVAVRPRDMESPTLTALTWVRAVYLQTDCLRLLCAQPFVPGNDWTHLAVQGSSLFIAIDCGVQFLTRSHRTALSEQTGPVPRVTTISFLGKTSYTVLVSGSAAPEVTVMMTVLLWRVLPNSNGSSSGTRNRINALKGRYPIPVRLWSHISVFYFASVYFIVDYCRMPYTPYPILEPCSAIVRIEGS